MYLQCAFCCHRPYTILFCFIIISQLPRMRYGKNQIIRSKNSGIRVLLYGIQTFMILNIIVSMGKIYVNVNKDVR